MLLLLLLWIEIERQAIGNALIADTMIFYCASHSWVSGSSCCDWQVGQLTADMSMCTLRENMCDWERVWKATLQFNAVFYCVLWQFIKPALCSKSPIDILLALFHSTIQNATNWNKAPTQQCINVILWYFVVNLTYPQIMVHLPFNWLGQVTSLIWYTDSKIGPFQDRVMWPCQSYE